MTTRILLIDGRSGSGKTTLARELAARESRRRLISVIHMDDLYPGWDGLEAGAHRLVAEVLEPIARGDVARWRPWDWERSAFGSAQSLAPGGTVIVEGCGSLSRASRPFAAAAVWLEAPDHVRRARAVKRSLAMTGVDDTAEWWDAWRAQEDAWFARERPRALADFIVSAGERVPAGLVDAVLAVE